MKKTIKKLPALLLSLMLAIGSTALCTAAEETSFSGGTGTATDPYLISTANDLVELSTLSNGENYATVSSAYFKLTADIDMTGKVYDGLGTNAPNNGWKGQFDGTIDGNGHVISNLEISNETGKTNVAGDSARGFIAFSSGATVKNLGLDTITVTTAGKAGGIIAFVSGSATVENCFVRNATITGSTAGSKNYSGGIIGYSQADKTVVVRNCYTIGNQGIYGQNDDVSNTTIENAYCGNGKGQFSQVPAVCKYVYRFANASTPSNYWHDGEQISEGITLANTLENLGSAFAADTFGKNGGYPVLAWENKVFSGGTGTEADPYLISTADDLVELSTLSNSKTNHATVSSAYFKLTADIDMTGKVYDGLGGNAPDNGWAGQFNGTIDGNGHVISNLEISNDEGKTNLTGTNRDFAKGFIAFSNGATVKNLGLDTITVTTAGRAGGIVAFTSGDTTIENCFVRNATISGLTDNTCAILGYAQNNVNVSIENCYAVANCGLVAGGTSGNITIKNCYSGNDKAIYINGNAKYSNIYRLTNANTIDNYYDTEGNYINSNITLTMADVINNMGSAFAADTFGKNGGYPVLVWENKVFSGGTGTETDPYLISTAADLKSLGDYTNNKSTAANFNNKVYKLTADIDMTGITGFYGIGNYDYVGTLFSGTIDGNGHVIKNMTLDNSTLAGTSNGKVRYAALIPTPSDVTVKNLGIIDSTVTGNDAAAVIFGRIFGSANVISNCYTKGVILTASSKAAFIAECNNIPAELTNCYTFDESLVGCTNANKVKITNAYTVTYGHFGAVPNNGVTQCYRFTNKSVTSVFDNISPVPTFEEAIVNLGSGFKADTTEINGGYPILAWQKGISAEINAATNKLIIRNADSSAASVTAVIAVFDADNTMKNVCGFAKNVAVSANGSLDVPFTAAATGKEYRAFVFDSIENITPLCGAVTLVIGE